MAHNNTEIEIKVKVTKKKFMSLQKVLDSEAEFIHKLHHIDTYYNPESINFMKDEVPARWLSIRERGENILVNYKHWQSDKTGEFTHCDEYETKIENKLQLENIINALGIRAIATVDKVRRKYRYNDEFEVCLDEVKQLGYFIEIESVKDFGSVKKTHEMIREFADYLGLPETKSVPGGYAYQLYILEKNK